MDSTNAKFDRRNFLKAGAAVAGVAGFPAIGRGQGATIQGGLLLTAFVFVAVNLIVDLLYLWVDPRLREQR